MSKIEPFEKYPHRYDDWFRKNRFIYYSELKAVKAQLSGCDGLGIEIGVGSGRFAAPLGIAIGVDPSPQMRMIAQGRDIKVMDSPAEDLPFDDSQFDFALMITTICFLDDIRAALKEAYRILRPGGAILIGFVPRESPLGMVYEQRKKDNLFYKVATFYSVDEVIYHLKDAGFTNFSFIQTIFHDLDEIGDIEPIHKGYGDGSFVVVKGDK
jgi:ubiquinone/menaquinone biosynthesis C-methylase UbiE